MDMLSLKCDQNRKGECQLTNESRTLLIVGNRIIIVSITVYNKCSKMFDKLHTNVAGPF